MSEELRYIYKCTECSSRCELNSTAWTIDYLDGQLCHVSDWEKSEQSKHETEEELQKLATEYSDNLIKGSAREFTHAEIVSLQLGFKAGRTS